MPKRLVISNWAPELRRFGYLADRRTHGAFCKSVGKRDLLIAKAPSPSSQTAVMIDLDVCSAYDGVSGGWRVLLRAGLKRNSAPVIGIGWGDLWEPDQADEALTALVTYGIPWLEAYATAEKLIEHFGGCVRAALAQQEQKPQTLADRLLAKKVPKHVFRPEDLWKLAELCFEIGDLDVSQSYAERYLSLLPNTEAFDKNRAEGGALLDAITQRRRDLAGGSTK